MYPAAFDILVDTLQHSQHLPKAYDNVIRHILAKPLWTSGPASVRRVCWLDADRALAADPVSFAAPGLYLWGVDDRPLYLGKTGASFRRRFRRYIWHERFQCRLAQDYEHLLRKRGLAGFPVDVRNWYSSSYRSTVRLVGAVRFANEGIANVWFALLPTDDRRRIRPLEKVLIPVANEWNRNASLAPLLNIEANRRARRSRAAKE